MFSPDELAAIERLANSAARSGDVESERLLAGVVAKLRALAEGSAGDLRLALFEEVLPAADGVPEPSTAARVRHAVERQEPIRIRYRANQSGEVTTRRVRPFNIHFYNGREYVEAFCELRGSDRIFALHNIEEILEGDREEAAAEEAQESAAPVGEG